MCIRDRSTAGPETGAVPGDPGRGVGCRERARPGGAVHGGGGPPGGYTATLAVHVRRFQDGVVRRHVRAGRAGVDGQGDGGVLLRRSTAGGPADRRGAFRIPTGQSGRWAVVGGLANSQSSNEPGGDRWTRHLDTVLGMFFRYTDDKAAAGARGKRLVTGPSTTKNSPTDRARPAAAGTTRRRRSAVPPSP